MRIEVSHFDERGTIGTDVLDLTAEQVKAIVQRARDLAMLRRAGKPISRALDQLDDALMSAHVIKGDERPADAVTGKAAQAPQLLEAFRDLQASAVATDGAADTVTVSRAALAGVGDALRAAVTAGAQLQWEWKAVQDGHAEISSDRVLERMSQVVKIGGAPNVHEAMTKYPLEFCQAYERLVEEEQRERAAGPGVTTVVHLEGEDGQTIASMVAPAGLIAPAVQLAVEQAVAGMSPSEDVDDLCRKLVRAGFEHIEHVRVDVGDINRQHESPEL